MKKPTTTAKAPKGATTSTSKKSAATKKARTKSKASVPTSKHALHVAHLKHEHAVHDKHVAHEVHIGKAPLAAGDVSCCTAEAVAASARLAGLDVGADDVLALYWRTAADPDAGASILATLKAAAEYGLAGNRPRWFVTVDPDRARGVCMRPWRRGLSEELDSSWERERSPGSIPGPDICAGSSVEERSLSDCLLVHVELPAGPHSLCTDPAGRGVWSWGDLYDPAELGAGPALEAWAVSWS